jgi:hypothetical protein
MFNGDIGEEGKASVDQSVRVTVNPLFQVWIKL